MGTYYPMPSPSSRNDDGVRKAQRDLSGQVPAWGDARGRCFTWNKSGLPDQNRPWKRYGALSHRLAAWHRSKESQTGVFGWRLARED
jgi:hypothetical protein